MVQDVRRIKTAVEILIPSIVSFLFLRFWHSLSKLDIPASMHHVKMNTVRSCSGRSTLSMRLQHFPGQDRQSPVLSSTGHLALALCSADIDERWT